MIITPERVIFTVFFVMFLAGLVALWRTHTRQHAIYMTSSFLVMVALFMWVAAKTTLFPVEAPALAGGRLIVQVIHDASGGVGILLGILQICIGALLYSGVVKVRHLHRWVGWTTVICVTTSFLSMFCLDLFPRA